MPGSTIGQKFLGFLQAFRYHTEMIRNKEFKFSFPISFITAILFHLVVLFFVKNHKLGPSNNDLKSLSKSHPIKLEDIKLIRPDEVSRLKRVGIKGGEKKDYLRPDIVERPRPVRLKSPGLSLGSLAPLLPPPNSKAKSDESDTSKNLVKKDTLLQKQINSLKATNLNSSDSSASHFYFNPKKEKKIAQNSEQNNLKQEAYKNISVDSANPVAQKISNFEIRYERPEGVSEDELNSDEKAYYAFFKRSYASYLSKLYASYDKIILTRPGLERDFEEKHLLIGKIDYDEKGNIVTIKILKSSDSDNVHYFFEETLKQLNLPNPPKSFIKAKKQFSTYYQIQIN